MHDLLLGNQECQVADVAMEVDEVFVDEAFGTSYHSAFSFKIVMD